MIKLLHKITNKLSGQLKSRVSSSRLNLAVPIGISFEPENNTGRLAMKREVLAIQGSTRDLSSTGVEFVVDSIRLREYYLVGEGRILDAELDLPGAKVKMKLIGLHYNTEGEHLSVCKYLIGASILNMTPLDRENYEDYLHNGKVKKNKRSLLELEASES